MERLITKSFRRLLDKGLLRGFITFEELGKSLGKRHYSQINIEKAFLYIFDNKVCLVEKKSDFRSIKKRDSVSTDLEKSKDVDKSDDPIRMYLREMGGVELLSREGEIAIAKRIEAGKNFMINGLFQSPITAKKVFEWKEKLEKNELLVREIIDIDSSYMESEDEESNSKKDKQINNKVEKLKKNTGQAKDDKLSEEGKEGEKQEYQEEDEFNPSLAAMEEEIKPQIISSVNFLCKEYTKLIKFQNEMLDTILSGHEIIKRKLKNYAKMQDNIVNKVKTLQLNTSVLEDLVQLHYQENKKIMSLEGDLMRLAMDNKIPRGDFLRNYLGNEINPNFESFPDQDANWKNFFKKKKKEFHEIQDRLVEFSKKIGLPISEFKKLLSKIQKGERESRVAKKKW